MRTFSTLLPHFQPKLRQTAVTCLRCTNRRVHPDLHHPRIRFVMEVSDRTMCNLHPVKDTRLDTQPSKAQTDCLTIKRGQAPLHLSHAKPRPVSQNTLANIKDNVAKSGMAERGHRTRGVLAAWRGNDDLHVGRLGNAATRGRVGYGIVSRSSQTLPHYHIKRRPRQPETSLSSG